MNNYKKITSITGLAIIVALASVFLCLFGNRQSYSAKMIVEDEWNINLINVSDIIYSPDTKMEKEPLINKNKINVEFSFSGKEDYIQFFFDVFNEGTVDGFLKDIKIEGLENKDDVRISVIGLGKDDIIESGRYVDNVKVVIERVAPIEGEEVEPITEDVDIVLDITRR